MFIALINGIYIGNKKKKKIYFKLKKPLIPAQITGRMYLQNKDELECKNVHNLGKYNFGENVKVFDGMYQDPEKGDLRKCHYAKIAKISWEGIDNLCPDVD